MIHRCKCLAGVELYAKTLARRRDLSKDHNSRVAMPYIVSSVVQSHKQIPLEDPGDFHYTLILSLATCEPGNDTATHVPDPTTLFVNVVIDLSYSMDSNDCLTHAKRAVKTMLKHIKGRDIAVKLSGFHIKHFSVTTDFKLVTDESLAEFDASIDGLTTQGGAGTNISDALFAARRDIDEEMAKVPGSHGYIVLMTDGCPNNGIQDGAVIYESLSNESKRPVNIGAIALGAQPERGFMTAITKGGKFFYAPNANALHDAYEEVESGFDQVVRNCDMRCVDACGRLLASKNGGMSKGETLSLAVDLEYAQMCAIPIVDGKKVLKLNWSAGGDHGGECEVVLTMGNGDPGDVPVEVVAHRQLLEVNRQIEEAIQATASQGVEVAIGRLVRVANAANVIAANTPNVPSVVYRSSMVNEAVRRTTSMLRQIDETPRPQHTSARRSSSYSVVARGLRQRVADIAPSSRVGMDHDEDFDEDFDEDDNGEPTYRSLESTHTPSVAISNASLNLIAGEMSSQLSSY